GCHPLVVDGGDGSGGRFVCAEGRVPSPRRGGGGMAWVSCQLSLALARGEGSDAECGAWVAAGIWSRAWKYSVPSMLMRGRIRPSQRGRYQACLPSMTIRAGTSRQRTMVASRMTAPARRMPNCLTVGSPLRTKPPNTNTMIEAAAVITTALVTSPEVTERV